jgi:hypothetical protein
VALVAAPVFVIASLSAPERTALFLIATLPFCFYPATVGGFSLFLAIPTFGFVSIVLLMRRRARLATLRRDLPVIAFAIVLAAAIVAAALSTDVTTAFSRVAYVALFGLFSFAMAAALADGRLTRHAVAKALLIAGGLAGAAVLIQFLAQFATSQNTVLDWLFDHRPLFAGERASEIRASNWVVPDLDVVRGVFPFMAPPAAGQFLMFSMLAGFWLRSERGRGRSAGLELILLVIVVAALLATLSRQSWLGAAVGLAALSLGRRPLWMLAILIQLVIVVSLVPVPGSNGSFGDYLLTAGDTSTESTGTRLDLWNQTIHLIPDHALVGAGPGLIESFGKTDRPFYAHNVFIDSAVELGIIGALALLAMFLSGLRAAYRRRASLAFAMLVAYVIAGLFDDVLYTPRNGLALAVAFALIAGGSATSARARLEPRPA